MIGEAMNQILTYVSEVGLLNHIDSCSSILVDLNSYSLFVPPHKEID